MIGWFSTFNIPRNTGLLQHKFQVLHSVFISSFLRPFFVSKGEIAIVLALEIKNFGRTALISVRALTLQD